MDEGGHDIFEGYGGERGTLPPYAALAGLFNLILAIFFLVSRKTGRPLPERVSANDIALLGMATHKLSMLVAQDAVTSPLRAPFTELEEKQSPRKWRRNRGAGGSGAPSASS